MGKNKNKKAKQENIDEVSELSIETAVEQDTTTTSEAMETAEEKKRKQTTATSAQKHGDTYWFSVTKKGARKLVNNVPYVPHSNILKALVENKMVTKDVVEGLEAANVSEMRELGDLAFCDYIEKQGFQRPDISVVVRSGGAYKQALTELEKTVINSLKAVDETTRNQLLQINPSWVDIWEKAQKEGEQETSDDNIETPTEEEIQAEQEAIEKAETEPEIDQSEASSEHSETSSEQPQDEEETEDIDDNEKGD